ncbi:integrase arm-type DNA-binding domain-containing protein [Bradyrhizobium sp. CW4]|uniref:tyrosine-type recombinase/integrase n=1 Tax=Bradyrhizobium sp. CW4 TaxID=2782687 RepID=UPI001FFB578A|nr:site-specific integrase [Bradyrhizobium sp. CW4]MCK1417638.1 integrase arm-type DNA-binding domain-containing protein [Bradyrhizobium sp. CW4]
MALSVKQITKLKQPGRYGDGHGLYLQVLSSSNRSWLLRYQRGGRERWMGLGPEADFTLEEARERARKARQLIKDGIDPIDERKSKRLQQMTEDAAKAAKAKTFGQVATEYFEFHSPKWKNQKHAAQFLSSLKTYAYPVIGKLPVAAVNKTLVLKVLQPIWKTKTETASRVRGRIEGVLDYARVNGWRDGDNPAAWLGNLEHALPAPGTISKVKHHAALPWTELPDFMIQLRQRDGVAAAALQFLILTATRTGEVIGATWDEIDLTAKVWTIPTDRMKAKRQHTVPLSDPVLQILKELPRESDFVFPGLSKGTAISNMAMAQLLKRMDRLDITVHGFRSTFRDWAAESTSYPNHVVEMALAHTIGDKVEAAYRRGELLGKRNRLMSDWARYCGSVKRSGEVVPLRGRK